MGIKILLDDFGSGYSSFGMIKDYDFDILKIDMSFVRQIGDNRKVRGIIRAIVDMCHQMGIKVVAEGTETKEQIDFLNSINCDFVQGYYYSKPITEEEFLAKLEEYDREEKIVRHTENDAPRICSYFKEGINFLSKESEINSNVDEYLISRVLEENNAVGIVCGSYDDGYPINFISDIALSLMGYKFDDFKKACGGSYLNLIAPEDLSYFLEDDGERTKIYRLIKSDGSRVMVVEKRVDGTMGNGDTQWVRAIRTI